MTQIWPSNETTDGRWFYVFSYLANQICLLPFVLLVAPFFAFHTSRIMYSNLYNCINTEMRNAHIYIAGKRIMCVLALGGTQSVDLGILQDSRDPKSSHYFTPFHFTNDWTLSVWLWVSISTNPLTWIWNVELNWMLSVC